MSRYNKIELFLDNDSDICYPGQTISGTVECFFTPEENFQSVKIIYSGRAETKWTEKENYYDEAENDEKTRDVEYSDGELYFYVEDVLVEGRDDYRPEPGNHTFPFSYVLPHTLPSSLEEIYGNIRYKVKAVMEPCSMPDHECEKIIIVLSPLDLNRLPNLREPVVTSVDATPCSFWCQNSGPITFTMSLGATGFVPGQEINIGAYVENMSNITVENVEFEILATFEYIALEKRKYEEKQITECTEGAVGAHGEKTWTATLTIPSYFPVLNLVPCKIINVKYTLKAKVVLPFPHGDLFDELKLMIGTVPLAGLNTSYPGPPPLQSDSGSYTPTEPVIENNSYGPTDGITPTPYHQPGYGLSVEGLPHPSASSTNPSDVPPYPSGTNSSYALPSYEEAQQLKQKDVKLQ